MQEINYNTNTVWDAYFTRSMTLNTDGSVTLSGTEQQIVTAPGGVAAYSDGGISTAYDTNGNFWVCDSQILNGNEIEILENNVVSNIFGSEPFGQIVPLQSGAVGLVAGPNGGALTFWTWSGSWSTGTASANNGYSMLYSQAATVSNSNSIYVASEDSSGHVDLLNFTSGSITISTVATSGALYVALTTKSTSISYEPDLWVFYGQGSNLYEATNIFNGGTSFTLFTISTSESGISTLTASPDRGIFESVIWTETSSLWYGAFD